MREGLRAEYGTTELFNVNVCFCEPSFFTYSILGLSLPPPSSIFFASFAESFATLQLKASSKKRNRVQRVHLTWSIPGSRLGRLFSDSLKTIRRAI